MTDYRQSSGWRVKLLRTAKGMTQAQLAQAVGVAGSTVSGIERNAQGVSQVAEALATALDTTTDYLLGRVDDPAPASGAPTALQATLLAEFERLGEVDRRALVEIALTLRIAQERRAADG